ncbi:hypothetical protein Tco_0782897, partial [Tanacetum coccineum]
GISTGQPLQGRISIKEFIKPFCKSQRHSIGALHGMWQPWSNGRNYFHRPNCWLRKNNCKAQLQATTVGKDPVVFTITEAVTNDVGTVELHFGTTTAINNNNTQVSREALIKSVMELHFRHRGAAFWSCIL